MSENKHDTRESFGEMVKRQISSNAYAMLLETVVMLAIAAYTISEIRDVRREVSEKVETSHQALMEYGRVQGEKLEAVSDELVQTTELLASAIGLTVEDYKENREQIYSEVKEGGKQALTDYLKAKFGSKEESEVEE